MSGEPDLNAPQQPSPVTDYLDYFGLEDDPFSPELLPFYDGGSRRELFTELLHLCQFSASLLVVLGEQGVGKSSLKTALCEQFDHNDIVCELEAPVLSRTDWLLGSISQQLGLDNEVDGGNSLQAVAAIRASVQDSDDHDCLKVVMIQNAQNLDAESLQTLLRLVAPGEPSPYRHLHIVLFATPNFAKRLPADEQTLLQVFHLPSLAPSEMQHYLRFRLDAVGFEGIFPFKESDVQFLWDISQGIPGKFHDAAREILIEQALPPPENKSLGLPVTHMAAVVALLAGLLMLFFYQGSDENHEGGEANNAVSVPEAAAQAPTSPPNLPGQNVPTASVNDPKVPTPPDAQASASDSSPAVAAIEANPPLPNPSITTKLASESKTSTPENQRSATKTTVATTATKTIEPTPPGTTSTQIAAQRESGIAPTPKTNASTANRNQAKEIDDLVAAAKQELVDEKIAKPASAPGKAVNSASTNFTDDETLLLSRAPDDYTLQVLAGGSREGVEEFIKRQPNSKDLAVFTARRGGKTLYIVVMGSFASSDAARLAVNTLPQEQRSAGPWPRSLQSVQADIRQFRGINSSSN